MWTNHRKLTLKWWVIWDWVQQNESFKKRARNNQFFPYPIPNSEILLHSLWYCQIQYNLSLASIKWVMLAEQYQFRTPRFLYLASTCKMMSISSQNLGGNWKTEQQQDIGESLVLRCLWHYFYYCYNATVKDLWGRVNTQNRASHSYILILWMSLHLKINGESGPLKWCYCFKILIIERQMSIQITIPKELSDFEHWNSKRNFPGVSNYFKSLGMIRCSWM